MCRAIAEIGPPGSGKGTAIKNVITPYCEKKGIPLVVIPMSREIGLYLDEHPSIAPEVRADMRAGRLVADNVVSEVLNRALDRVEKTDDSLYILDGMPRTMGQIEVCLYGACAKLGIEPKDYLFLNFVTPPHLCGYRAANRDENREDDEQGEDSFIVRWDQYLAHTVSVINHISGNHRRLGADYQEINGQYVRKSPELARGLIFGHQ